MLYFWRFQKSGEIWRIARDGPTINHTILPQNPAIVFVFFVCIICSWCFIICSFDRIYTRPLISLAHDAPLCRVCWLCQCAPHAHRTSPKVENEQVKCWFENLNCKTCCNVSNVCLLNWGVQCFNDRRFYLKYQSTKHNYKLKRWNEDCPYLDKHI